MSFDLKKVARLVNDNNIRLTMIVGKYDKVIRPENMSRLLKHVRNYKLEVLESGHTGLIHESLWFLTRDEE